MIGTIFYALVATGFPFLIGLLIYFRRYFLYNDLDREPRLLGLTGHYYTLIAFVLAIFTAIIPSDTPLKYIMWPPMPFLAPSLFVALIAILSYVLLLIPVKKFLKKYQIPILSYENTMKIERNFIYKYQNIIGIVIFEITYGALAISLNDWFLKASNLK